MDNIRHPITLFTREPDTDLGDFGGIRFPSKMHISLNSGCNLSCKHCPRSHADYGGVLMPKPMIDSIVRDFFPKIRALRLGGSDFGEQMMSPHFNYFLEQSRGHSIDIELVTNATAVSAKNAELMVSTLAIISISLEGMGRNFERIRGFKWDRLVANIRLLIETRRRMAQSRPIVQFAVTVIRNFKADYFRLIDFSKQNGIDSLVFRNFVPVWESERCGSLYYYRNEHNEFYDELSRRAEESGVRIERPPPLLQRTARQKSGGRKPCAQPFEVFGVQSNGQITSCPVNPCDLGYYVPGDAGVRERWSSPQFIRLRETVNSDHPLPACAQCEIGSGDASASIRQFPSLWEKAIWRGATAVRLLQKGQVQNAWAALKPAAVHDGGQRDFFQKL